MIEETFIGEPNLYGYKIYGIRVGVNEPKALALWKWCKDNGIHTSGIKCLQHMNESYWFYFEQEEDFVAFKLRWQ